LCLNPGRMATAECRRSRLHPAPGWNPGSADDRLEKMSRRSPPNTKSRKVSVAITINKIPCIIEGIEIDDPRAAPERHGKRRLWHTIRGAKTGSYLVPEWLELKGWLDVELRAEASYRHVSDRPERG